MRLFHPFLPLHPLLPGAMRGDGVAGLKKQILSSNAVIDIALGYTRILTSFGIRGQFHQDRVNQETELIAVLAWYPEAREQWLQEVRDALMEAPESVWPKLPECAKQELASRSEAVAFELGGAIYGKSKGTVYLIQLLNSGLTKLGMNNLGMSGKAAITGVSFLGFIERMSTSAQGFAQKYPEAYTALKDSDAELMYHFTLGKFDGLYELHQISSTIPDDLLKLYARDKYCVCINGVWKPKSGEPAFVDVD